MMKFTLVNNGKTHDPLKIKQSGFLRMLGQSAKITRSESGTLKFESIIELTIEKTDCFLSVKISLSSH